jgi:NAD-dependent dihydropyrimidine dehydrogenase PreA subunit
MDKKACMISNPVTPGAVIIIDQEICIGCNFCVEVCRSDVILPSREKQKPPIVMYPDECWFCGSCVEHCLKEGAIRMEHPLNQRVGWKRKETGEFFRIGMKNPPPPNKKPPIPDYHIKDIVKVKLKY